MTVFDEAIRFAVEKHSGTLRKSDASPYILHVMEAAVIVGTMTSDPEVLAAAVLHDTVEDTDATAEELAERFGPRVAALVSCETEKKRRELPPELSWRIRKEESLEELRNTADPAVKLLWLGDKLSNIRSLYRSKRALGDKVWTLFHQKDPAQHAWYYRSVAALLSDLHGYDAWQEFHRLVETVFAGIE